MLKCANLCGDADTVTSVCGQIAGAIYGVTDELRVWWKDVCKWDGEGESALRGWWIVCGKKGMGRLVCRDIAKESLANVPIKSDDHNQNSNSSQNSQNSQNNQNGENNGRNVCTVCQKESSLRCATCKESYCSKECQKKDWAEHKKKHPQ